MKRTQAGEASVDDPQLAVAGPGDLVDGDGPGVVGTPGEVAGVVLVRRVEPGGDVWTRRDLSGTRWNVLADPVDHFYADPFPISRQGRDYLFFEDLDHKTQKGIISMVAFDEAGRPGPAVPVLEEPWHLSYPFLIERGRELFMIPESSANRDIALYRAVEFPLKWQRHAVLVEGVEAAGRTPVPGPQLGSSSDRT